jgi:hypothetical protein
MEPNHYMDRSQLKLMQPEQKQQFSKFNHVNAQTIPCVSSVLPSFSIVACNEAVA